MKSYNLLNTLQYEMLPSIEEHEKELRLRVSNIFPKYLKVWIYSRNIKMDIELPIKPKNDIRMTNKIRQQKLKYIVPIICQSRYKNVQITKIVIPIKLELTLHNT